MIAHRCGHAVKDDRSKNRKRRPRSDRRYCSNACRQRAYRERKGYVLTALELDALMWRHDRVLRLLQRPPAALTEVAAIDALIAVVAPSEELLEASLAAVAEKQMQEAA